MHYISIDVGTTNLKLCLFDASFEWLDQWVYGYQNSQVFEDQHTMDIEEIWNALEEGIQKFVLNYQLQEFECVLTTAMHSLILLDSDKEALTPLYTWADNLGKNTVEGMSKAEKATAYQLSGTPCHPMNPYYKLLELSHQEAYSDTVYVASVKDILYNRLTGFWKIDVGCAAATGLYSWQEQDWSSELLSYVGLSKAQLPMIVEPTHCDALLAYRSRLYIGTSDGVSSNYVFSNLPDSAVLSVGTSHAVRVVSNYPSLNFSTQNFCYEFKKKQYLVGYPSNNGGNVLEWLLQKYQTNFEELEEIIQSQSKVKAIFKPYVYGERAPVWDAQAKPRLSILNHHQVSREEILYASICGVFFNIKENVSHLRQLVEFNRLGLVGGITQSPILCQLLCDILGYECDVPTSMFAETKGTLVLVKDCPNNIQYQVYKPDIEKVDYFKFIYESYQKY